MQTTREKLVDTARRLFAERGVDPVSLREISRAAEQRNVSALQYHFGDREGLLRAVLAPHEREVDARRRAVLDELATRSGPDLRDFADALVRPPAALLGDPGGREYLRIVGQRISRPVAGDAGAGVFIASGSLQRWRSAVSPLLSAEGLALHRRFSAIQLTYTELGRRAELSRRNHELFTSHLVDLAAAVLAAPISEETRRLLTARAGGRGRRGAGRT